MNSYNRGNQQWSGQRNNPYGSGGAKQDSTSVEIQELSKDIKKALDYYKNNDTSEFQNHMSARVINNCKSRGGGKTKWHEYLAMVRRLKAYIEQPQNKGTWQKEAYRVSILLKYMTAKQGGPMFPAVVADVIVEKVINSSKEDAIIYLKGLELIISAIRVEVR